MPLHLLPVKQSCILLVAAALLIPAHAHAEEILLPVKIAASENGMKVTIDGKLFTEYHTDAGGRPVLWPVVGPTGAAMTRSYPVGATLPGEATDHPHQRSLWFGHESVDGVDFWHDPALEGAAKQSNRGRQVHRKFKSVENSAARARIETIVDWESPTGEVLATDVRTYHFAATKNHRWIDFTIAIQGKGKPVVLGDIKDGSFACRVPATMKVDANLGGHIVNSEGQRDKACWGQPAQWVDYHGPVYQGPVTNSAGQQETVGIAILSHPSNFRPLPRWHVRNYGLFAVNPFGEKQFPPLDGKKQGAVKIAAGDTLTLRYRVILHKGDESSGGIAEQFKRYAAE